MKTKIFFKTLLAVMVLAMTAIACSNDDDNNNATCTDKGKVNGISVTIKFDAQPDLAQFANGIVISYVNGRVTTDTLDFSKTYTKQITADNPTDTAGFGIGYVVLIGTKPNVGNGTYTGKYNLTCTAKTTEGGKETSSKTYTDKDKEFKAIVDSDNIDIAVTDTIISHVYAIDNNGNMVEVDNKYDDDTVARPETPANDMDTPFLSGNFYYYNNVSTKDNENKLSDNIAARFAHRTQWTTEDLTYGDILYINGNDITSIDKTLLRRIADNGTVFIIEGTKNQVETFCKTTDTPCLITPACNDDMYIIAKGVTENNLPKADPIFIQMSPQDEDGNIISDYTQGVVIDMALKNVKRYLSGDQDNTRARLTATTRADNPTQALNQLISAYRVSLFLTQSVKNSEYRNPKLKGLHNEQENIYEINYSIWNVFSINEKRNYYYVHQDMDIAFSPCYVNVYNKSVSGIAKVCEWYGKNVITRLTPNTEGMHIENSSPATTEGSTTYTSGISYGISGTIGYINGGPQVSASASLTFSSSSSYNVPDIAVFNRCLPGQKFEWEYDLADVVSSFSMFSTAMTSLRPGAAAGRASLIAGTDYMFSFPESSGEPKMEAYLEVLLRSSCSKCGYTCKVRDKIAQNSKQFNLPYLTSKDFEKK